MNSTTDTQDPLPNADDSGSTPASSATPGERHEGKSRPVHHEQTTTRHNVTIAAKVTPETKQHLDRIVATLGSGNTSRGLTDIIEILADALDSADTSEAAQKNLTRRLAKEQSQLAETIPALDRQLLEDLRDALNNIDSSYRDMSFQIQKVGYNWSQIARVANLIGGGSDDQIPATALDSVRRSLDSIDRKLGGISTRDTAIKTALSRLRT